MYECTSDIKISSFMLSEYSTLYLLIIHTIYYHAYPLGFIKIQKYTIFEVDKKNMGSKNSL